MPMINFIYESKVRKLPCLWVEVRGKFFSFDEGRMEDRFFLV